MMAKVLYVAAFAGVALILAAAIAVRADRRPADLDLAAPGAQLYQTAVVESVRTLAERKDPSRPPAPAGQDVYWCEKCKAYHQRPAAPDPEGAAPAGVPQVHAAAGPPAQEAEPGGPSPGPDHYYCPRCKTYHRRPAGQPQPGRAAADSAHVHGPADQAAGSDYYYCEECKAYHRRAVEFSRTPDPAEAPSGPAAEGPLPEDR
jgi:hypothetical protein